MLFKRIKDWAVRITSFRTGDVLPVDGPSGTAKIRYSDLAKEVIKDSANNDAATEADLVAGSALPIMTANGPKSLPGNTLAKASEQTALTTYVQNVAHSIAPEFDPTRTSENPYKAGESVTYTDGKTYMFKVDHYGAWAAADVDETDVQTIYASSIDMFGRFIPMSKSKNIFSKDLCRVMYPYYLANNLVNAGAGGYIMVYRVIAGTYTLSLPTGSYSKFNVGYIEEYPHKSSSCTVVSGSAVTHDSRDYKTVSMANGAKYLLVYFNRDGSGYDNDTLLSSLMIQEGSAKSEFEAFSFDGFNTNDYDIQKIDSDVKNHKTRIDALESYDDEIDKIQGKGLFSGILNGLTVVSMTDISSGIDFSEIDNYIYNTTSGNTYVLNGFGISEAIAVDHEKSYVAKIRNNSSQNVYVMYFSDVAGTETLYGTAGKPSLPSISIYVINPPAEAKSFRLCGAKGQVSLYEAVFGVATDAANVESLLNAYFKNASLVIDESVISQVTLNSLNRLDRSSGLSVSSSTGVVSDPIVADFNNVYVLDTEYDQYRAPVAFYKDVEGYVLDSFQFPNVSAATTINHKLIVIPPTSKSFRICSRTSNINLYKAHFEMTSSDAELTERVSELEEEVATLESSAFLDQTIDTINAVKYIPQKTLKLGPDLFDLSEASYDTNKWSVSGGAITFTSSAISTAEFDTGIVIPEGKVYYAEVTVDNYDVLTNLFTLKVGATGPEYDVYDGTTTPSGSLIGNGGTLCIVPGARANLDFTIRMVLSEVVSSGESRTLTLNIKNVSCGNADGKIVDAKWNIAIGPRESCFANNVNATRCIAVGFNALVNLKSGWQNIAIGTFAMCQLKKGDRNIALGSDNTYMMEEGTDNVAIGRTCLSGVSFQPYSNFRADRMVIIGNFSGGIRGYGESESVYIGYQCARGGIGSKCVCIGANIPAQNGAVNRIAIGHGATNNVDNTTVIGNSDITETKVFGDFVVRGTDNVERRIVFNNDNTCSWEVVS